MQKRIPIRSMVENWKGLEEDAKSLAKRLTSKEAATPSLTWKLLSSAKPEDVLFLAATGKQQAVNEKIKNFFGKWRQNMQKFPLPEMTELQITAAMPNYKQIVDDAFLLMLDGKLHTHSEIMKHFKPLAPPPPPPPPPPKRGRGAKAAEAAAAATPTPTAGKAGGKPGKKGAAPPAPALQPAVAKTAEAAKKTSAPAKEATSAKKAVPVKAAPAKESMAKAAVKAAPAKVEKKAAAKPPSKAAKPAAKPVKGKPSAKKAAKKTGKKK
jgi:hypothetical protein